MYIRPARASGVSRVSEIVERAYRVYIENVAVDPPHQGAGAGPVDPPHQGAGAGPVDPPHQGAGAGQYFNARRPTRASSEPELRLYSNGNDREPWAPSAPRLRRGRPMQRAPLRVGLLLEARMTRTTELRPETAPGRMARGARGSGLSERHAQRGLAVACDVSAAQRRQPHPRTSVTLGCDVLTRPDARGDPTCAGARHAPSSDPLFGSAPTRQGDK
jgi:hypothetical protein